jgi:L-cystine transport system permease protein
VSSGTGFEYIAKILPKLMTVVPLTLLVVLVAGVLGFFLGIIVTAIRVKKVKVLFQIVSVYVSFMRSTPSLIQLFVVYYGMPILFKLAGIDIQQWSRTGFAILTLVLHNGAYLSEVMRPAYLAVDKGQHDAADSIGLTGTQKFLRIICPQVVPIALPSLGNLLIDLIKDTSILFTIGVVDLMGKAKLIITSDYGVAQLKVYIILAIIYWIISAAAEKGIHILEDKNRKYKFDSVIKA